MIPTLLADATPGASATDIAEVARTCREIIVAIVSILGLIIAFLGLHTWRRQLRGNTEYELGRRLLRAAFKARDALRTVRNPFMSPSEIEDALKDSGVTPEEMKTKQFDFDSNGAVYNVRWKQVADALSDLKIESLEAEVLWGAAINDALKPLHDCVAKLRLALVRYLRQAKPARRPLTPEQLEEIDGIIYEISEDPSEDEFTAEIQTAVDGIQNFVKPKLKI